MDKFIKEKEKLEETIRKYKAMIVAREKQNSRMKKMFGELFVSMLEENLYMTNYLCSYQYKLKKHFSKISEIPIEPNKILELPQDCMDEIMCYFEKCEDFWNLKLVCKAININNREFKNIKFHHESIINLNHGKVELIKYDDDHCYVDNGYIKIKDRLGAFYFENFQTFKILMRYAKNKKVPMIVSRGKSYEMPEFSLDGKHGSQLIDIGVLNFENDATSFILASNNGIGSYVIHDMKSILKERYITCPVKVGIYSLDRYCIQYIESLTLDKYGLIDIKTLANFLPKF